MITVLPICSLLDHCLTGIHISIPGHRNRVFYLLKLKGGTNVPNPPSRSRLFAPEYVTMLAGNALAPAEGISKLSNYGISVEDVIHSSIANHWSYGLIEPNSDRAFDSSLVDGANRNFNLPLVDCRGSIENCWRNARKFSGRI